MVSIIRTHRSTAWAALLLAVGLTSAACSSSASTPAAAASQTGIGPGAGQSTLAGMPGSTATGPLGGSGSPMPGMTMTDPSASGSAGASGAATVPVSGNSVTIKNFAFAPAALTVKAGTKVTWTNQDSDAHTVTSQNNTGPLASAALSTGQSYSYTFTKPGTYSYLCTIHPFMTATVTVTP
jgi:plastocyanin